MSATRRTSIQTRPRGNLCSPCSPPSQLEREQLKQRQREGIKIAKAQGKYTGRNPIPIDWNRFDKLYGEWKSKNITGRDFMRRMDLSANTFFCRVREYEVYNGIAEPTSD